MNAILPVLPPAADDVEVLLLEHLDHAGNVGRIVLVVAVRRDDVAAARVLRSRRRTPRSARSCAGSGSRGRADPSPAAAPAARTCRPAPVVDRDDLVASGRTASGSTSRRGRAARRSATRSASGRRRKSQDPYCRQTIDYTRFRDRRSTTTRPTALTRAIQRRRPPASDRAPAQRRGRPPWRAPHERARLRRRTRPRAALRRSSG